MKLFAWLSIQDWRRGIALVILWANCYQLIAWPLLFWLTTILTAVFGVQVPAPPIVPWEQLFVGTSTLAAVGGLHTLQKKYQAEYSDKPNRRRNRSEEEEEEEGVV